MDDDAVISHRSVEGSGRTPGRATLASTSEQQVIGNGAVECAATSPRALSGRGRPLKRRPGHDRTRCSDGRLICAHSQIETYARVLCEHGDVVCLPVGPPGLRLHLYCVFHPVPPRGARDDLHGADVHAAPLGADQGRTTAAACFTNC